MSPTFRSITPAPAGIWSIENLFEPRRARVEPVAAYALIARDDELDVLLALTFQHVADNLTAAEALDFSPSWVGPALNADDAEEQYRQSLRRFREDIDARRAFAGLDAA